MLDSFKVALFELKFEDSRSTSMGKNTVITLHSQCSVESVQLHFFACISSFPTFCSAVPTSPIIHCCIGSVKESPAAFRSFLF